ncbi:MAG: S41 family peptidase [Bacteroidetes bacterium]|jgi:carboxyl-terminal processing protease|nr:S41 family peptidase [Bacteroidota bacterium]MBT4728397.1 S41 family peptidase [Bacteroidota bacterium]MBT4969931.1 S41 family peptidase [Bacteroidota bacterium]MBT6836390.1 S41 family peptidase [Bacteroidota bacterium]MBT7038302.1 S41 family peptidase [Bacteroidota bacterium]
MNRYVKTFSLLIFSIFLIYPTVNAQTAQKSDDKKSEMKKEYGNQFEISKNLEIYVDLFKELNAYYVDDINPAELIQLSIKSMLKSLDPYTVFFPESDYEDFRFLTTGNYGGIGAKIGKKGDYVVITEPYEGFPAHKYGLIAGDQLSLIGDKSAKGMTTAEVSNLLKGQPGTEIDVTVKRPGQEEELVLHLKREKIQIENVAYAGMLDKNIGYINLTGFKQNAADDVKKALEKLQSENDVQSLVLDLRSNPGGLLIESVKIVGLFVDKGEMVVSTRGKVESWNKEYRTMENPIAPDLPLVVLTNGGSASASEIVSGALQDLDRAIIIGERTLGKGLVQTTRSLNYNSQLKVTTSKYYIPSGRCIQEIDYSHKNDAGVAIKVADSLISEFKTKNGRIVFDGKGVLPDIVTQSDKQRVIMYNIIADYLAFDFATDYYLKHPEIASADEFRLSESDYTSFVDFVASKNLTYKNPSEKALGNFKAKAEKDDYFDAIEDDYKQMLETIEEQKRNEILKYKGEISKYLENEIVSRYYFQKGRRQASLARDNEVEEALKVLSNLDNYNKILQPN